MGEGAYSSYLIDGYTGMEGRLEQPLTFDEVLAGEEFFRFYDMQLLSGGWVSAKSEYCQVNIMESTARRMGWNPEEAVGKQLFFVNREQEPMTVIGVVKDCAYKSPTAELPNTVFVNTDQMKWMHARCFVLFKYRPGTWDECRRRIEEMQRAELPDRKLFLYSEEERYNDYLKSEDALSSLLGFSSCSDETDLGGSLQEIQTISSITLNQTAYNADVQNLYMLPNQEIQLSCTVLPEEANDKSVKWTSQNETVAVVSADGYLVTKNVGTTVVRVTPGIGFGPSATTPSFTINVVDHFNYIEEITLKIRIYWLRREFQSLLHTK